MKSFITYFSPSSREYTMFASSCAHHFSCGVHFMLPAPTICQNNLSGPAFASMKLVFE